jgi:hypothetical protein
MSPTPITANPDDGSLLLYNFCQHRDKKWQKGHAADWIMNWKDSALAYPSGFAINGTYCAYT